jgi:hypothetical protein
MSRFADEPFDFILRFSESYAYVVREIISEVCLIRRCDKRIADDVAIDSITIALRCSRTFYLSKKSIPEKYLKIINL